MGSKSIPFWETTVLADMTGDQWESLCDGCARCCLHKLQDRESGRVYFTMVACRLLDRHTCRCRDYRRRTEIVPECLRLSADNLHTNGWLPATCAYRKLAAGELLSWWHPLVSGDRETVHRAGVSIQGMT
nr:YcgN family cysteine cluster protein [Desulfobacterales bacterium]